MRRDEGEEKTLDGVEEKREKKGLERDEVCGFGFK